MSAEEADLLNVYAGKGLLLDANLLLLLTVGTCDREQVGRFKRLSMFAPEDFDILIAVVARFRNLYITPNIATEVSNLAGALSGKLKEHCFRVIAESLHAATEIVVASAVAADHDLFVEFGLTDAVIHICGGEPPLVLTVDFPLAQTLASRGRPVINFNHLRYQYWQ